MGREPTIPDYDSPETGPGDIGNSNDPSPDPGSNEYGPLGEPGEGDIYVPSPDPGSVPVSDE